MTIQPSAPQPPAVPSGWYPHPPQHPTTLRFWDGARWTDQVAPLPIRPAVMPLPQGAYAPARPQHVSGLTTGQHILCAILTVCTLGLFAPVWALAAFLGRRRIS